MLPTKQKFCNTVGYKPLQAITFPVPIIFTEV